MNDQERQEWSRHFDTLQWVVISIVSTGVGTLIAASFRFNDTVWPEWTGMALTILGVLYVKSFRIFRARLHQDIEDQQLKNTLSNLHGNSWIKQWFLFVISFMIIDAIFVYKITCKTKLSYGIGLILFFVIFLVLSNAWWKGRHEVNQSQT